jgi:hypothetical protein
VRQSTLSFRQSATIEKRWIVRIAEVIVEAEATLRRPGYQDPGAPKESKRPAFERRHVAAHTCLVAGWVAAALPALLILRSLLYVFYGRLGYPMDIEWLEGSLPLSGFPVRARIAGVPVAAGGLFFARLSAALLFGS